MSIKEKIKGLSRKQKMTIAVITVLVVFGGSFGYKVYADSQVKKKTEQVQVQINKQVSELRNLESEISALFSVEHPDFLSKDVSEQTITSIQEKLKKTEKKYNTLDLSIINIKTKEYSNELASIKKSLETVESMLATQKQVNGLFEKTAISGDTVNKDVAIKDDLKSETLEKLKGEMYFYLPTDVEDERTEWEKAINSLFDNAEEQLKQINTAKQSLEKVYKDNKVVENLSKENYEKAKSEVKKIKNQKIKKDLSDKLVKVKQEIDSKEKTEAEKKAEEQKKSTAQTDTGNSATNNQNQVADNSQTASNANNSADYSSQVNNNGGYTPPASNGGGSQGNGNGSYTPPASNGGGSQGSGNTGGGSQGESGSSGGNNSNNGGSTGGSVNPPTGWISSPHPIESQELWDWLWANGYSGYDSSGGYIRPY